MQSVRESRDHHLFDGYPGLIAVFRALQSLLMPRHPPCALSSLTTRIERSQPGSLQGEPSKRTISSRSTTFKTPNHRRQARRLLGAVTFLAASTPPARQAWPELWNAEPWENASGHPPNGGDLRHSFKMPTTTTKLSRNETGRHHHTFV